MRRAAEVSGRMAFSSQTRVTVVGAARSGVAAAELLARRGARVTVTDGRREIDARRMRSRMRGIALELGGHRAETLASRGPRRGEPGRAARSAGARRRRGARACRSIGELELASRWLQGRVIAVTGTKGKSTTTTLAGRMLEAAGFRVRGGRQHRRAAERAGGRLDARHAARRRGEQLPAGSDRRVPPVDRGAVELLAGPPRSAPDDRGVRGGEGADLREADAGRLGGGERGRRVGARDGGRREERGTSRYGFDARGEGSRVARRAIVERRRKGRHDARAASSACVLRPPHPERRGGGGGHQPAWPGRRAEAMTQAVSAFPGLEHAMELVATVDGVRFVERLEGHQRRVGAAVDRERRPRSGRHPRRPLQGRRVRAICGPPLRERGGWRGGDRRSAAAHRRALDDLDGAGARGRVDGRRGATRDSRWRVTGGDGGARAGVRELRHVRATTRSADDGSRRRCSGSPRSGRADRESSEQSSVGVRDWELAAGNAGCPGLRSSCPDPD